MLAKQLVGMVFASIVGVTQTAHARDTALHLPIAGVIENAEFKSRLANGAALHFGSRHPASKFEVLGEFVTNKKTNAVGKSDEVACRWVMLTALLQLQQRARELGANAIVDIRSYYKRNEFNSDTEYECHAGGVMAGVALKARFVELSH